MFENAWYRLMRIHIQCSQKVVIWPQKFCLSKNSIWVSKNTDLYTAFFSFWELFFKSQHQQIWNQHKNSAFLYPYWYFCGEIWAIFGNFNVNEKNVHFQPNFQKVKTNFLPISFSFRLILIKFETMSVPVCVPVSRPSDPSRNRPG